MAEVCRQCGAAALITDFEEGTVVCSECGLVHISGLIDDSAEWRFFDEDSGRQDPRRVGGTNNMLLSGQGLSTVIGGGQRGQRGGLADWNNRIANVGADTALVRAYGDIRVVCHALGLSEEVEEQACIIFKLALESGKLKRRPRIALIAAIVFISCRKKGQPRSIDDIYKVKECKRDDIMKCYKLVRQTVPLCSSTKTPVHYAQRFATRLGFASTEKTVQVAEKVHSMGFLEGRSPKTVAAVCVFFAARIEGTPLRVSAVIGEAGITEVTFKSAYQLLTANQEEILNAVVPGG